MASQGSSSARIVRCWSLRMHCAAALAYRELLYDHFASDTSAPCFCTVMVVVVWHTTWSTCTWLSLHNHPAVKQALLHAILPSPSEHVGSHQRLHAPGHTMYGSHVGSHQRWIAPTSASTSSASSAFAQRCRPQITLAACANAQPERIFAERTTAAPRPFTLDGRQRCTFTLTARRHPGPAYN
jgi:hypothetical protein